ncbi:hypothetical protein M9H77_14522 [Catharanthus roseus]|uniref:Uncharacterized protein n=1 Tax=Catharanthus roseus TaxID=4058 RepID=A0ACC0BNJ3_CATRO|nr:hypothetical protein M9H77_14522 [Catharanthus roseus]
MYVVIPSVAEPLAALLLLQYIFGDRVDKIYRVQGSLELSFFRVIVIIQFRWTRDDGSSETIRVVVVICSSKVDARIQQEYESLPSLGGVE